MCIYYVELSIIWKSNFVSLVYYLVIHAYARNFREVEGFRFSRAEN